MVASTQVEAVTMLYLTMQNSSRSSEFERELLQRAIDLALRQPSHPFWESHVFRLVQLWVGLGGDSWCFSLQCVQVRTVSV